MRNITGKLIIQILCAIILFLFGFILTLKIGTNELKRVRKERQEIEIVETESDEETTSEETEIEEETTVETVAELAERDPYESVLIDIGEYTLTAYCPNACCCGEYANGYTATGTKAVEGKTIAVDPSVIPYGSRVMINGREYIAEDCGGAINGRHIDVYFDTHEAAVSFGVQTAEVYLIGD